MIELAWIIVVVVPFFFLCWFLFTLGSIKDGVEEIIRILKGDQG